MKRSASRTPRFFAALAGSLLASTALAGGGTWAETGPDASQTLPGNVTSGIGALIQITGAIGLGGQDADIYCIRIVDRAAFSATTVGQTTLDTQLFLFDSTGKGVTFNDDATSNTNQSTITGQFVPAAGVYFLAITRYDYDATSAGGEIWADSPFVGERAPNGPGAAGALSGWSGSNSIVGPYGITLTGAEFHVDASPAKCPPNFAAPVNYGAGAQPRNIVVGDLNRDGRVDLAVANITGGSVSVLLGNGNGTFQPAVNYATIANASYVAIGDLNNDGKLDLVVSNVNGGRIVVLLGNGDGTFQAATPYSVLANPEGIATGDFNGDGRLDVAIGYLTDNRISILLGVGDGTLQGHVTYPAGAFSRGILAGDFNGDGKLDLVSANPAGIVSLLVGNGDGAFQPPVSITVGGGPRGLAAADVNGDGRMDLFVGNDSSGNVSVLLGNGNGTFQAGVGYAAGLNPAGVAIADINADGKPDLIASGFAVVFVSVLLGNGNGTFQAPSMYTAVSEPSRVAIGDFNADGRLDLIASNFSTNISVLLQQPGSSGPTITTHPTPKTVLTGDSTSFAVAATSSTPLTYQWRRNGVNLIDEGSVAGSLMPTLQISPVLLGEDASAFDCVVTNACGSTTSKPAGIAVSWRCPADFNQSGVKDVTDIFAFLTAWFGNCP